MPTISLKEPFIWLENSPIKNLISVLKSDNNHTFCFVGGCLRDSLIKKPFTDYDIASSNTPEENMLLLKKFSLPIIPIGIKHGTISTIIENQSFEITSLRKDIATNGRHAEVIFTKDFFEDSLRRDFTFNALYFNPISAEFYDYHNGVEDLLNRKINFIGNPADRIKEDYLRILRYFRFFCFFADNIDKDSLEIIKYLSPNLKNLSRERISQEFIKILTHPNPTKTLRLMEEYEVFNNLFAIDKYSILKFENICEIEKVFNLEPNLILRASYLLNNPEEVNKFILKKSDAMLIKNVVQLKNFINQYKVVDYGEICELVLHYGYESLINALIINGSVESYNKHHYIEIINKLTEKSQLEFPISGNDLINLGLNSTDIGIYMKKIKLIFWQYPLKTKEEYLEIIKNWLKV
ncbi:MAG: CCA tRNA nucleotidyltransferase [Alphaproteobacteria bacterium]|jgi:poly(A) polymerase|nr:CCA tRNA nucleotidyltransferase [Alphaproteobacteria bacterium]